MLACSESNDYYYEVSFDSYYFMRPYCDLVVFLCVSSFEKGEISCLKPCYMNWKTFGMENYLLFYIYFALALHLLVWINVLSSSLIPSFWVDNYDF